MRQAGIRTLVEMALSIALAAILNRFAVLKMPFGGSISLDMLPIFVLALRRGPAAGVLAGVGFGFIDYLAEPYFVHWAQLLLDYPVAFGSLGLAGLMRPLARRARSLPATLRALATGCAVGATGRFASHWLSGVVFFGEYAPEGQPVWLYSLVYNGSYLIPSVIVCTLAALAVFPQLERVVPSGSR